PAGGIVRLSGQAQSFKGTLQLKITSLAAVPAEEVDIARFLPACPGDIPAMAAELRRLAKSVDNPFLRELLFAFFQNRKFFEQFKKAPAAKGMHHAYIGGLLEHTLAATRLAEAVCTLYPTLDRSLLMAGAMLHDIGKVEEFSFATHPFDYSDAGRLMGHMVLGVEMVQKRLDAIPHFPKELAIRIKHLILSHHGRHEFGSPTVPMMGEAFVLNFLDDLDAKINYVDRLSSQMQAEGYQWTDYQRTMERFLYVQGHPDRTVPAIAAPEENSAPEVDPRQRSLWDA
ncbi:MAG: HDIG domain-containing protein, partial [Desulfobulbaceae bacterium]|nr:HDIG domain-containing protein [Desulfobulbaceae bacterium]